CRGELGPHDRRQALGSLHARRFIREAQTLDGPMGNVLHNETSGRSSEQRHTAAAQSLTPRKPADSSYPQTSERDPVAVGSAKVLILSWFSGRRVSRTVARLFPGALRVASMCTY